MKLHDATTVAELLATAMQAEKAAYELYLGFAKRFPEGPAHEFDEGGRRGAALRKMLIYIASMEMGHYRLLEVEEQRAREFDTSAIVWDLAHVGP